MKQSSPSMAAFQKRQANRAKIRIARDLDIQASIKAGATLATLGRKYQITMERVRQIGKVPQ
jgi:DNA-directed RNA polymerase sigma subunit (sigma70/sigma32)